MKTRLTDLENLKSYLIEYGASELLVNSKALESTLEQLMGAILLLIPDAYCFYTENYTGEYKDLPIKVLAAISASSLDLCNQYIDHSNHSSC